jgi:TRAP-type mannitol/chloroaromatic compound transport system permease small subunit
VNGLLCISRRIDWLNGKLGVAIGWLILVTTLISAYNALVRKAFNISSNGLLEIQWYLFGAVFLLGAAYTLKENAHVRIDILAQRFPLKVQIWIDILGHLLFMLPLIAFVTIHGLDFAWKSYQITEYSPDVGGLIRWPAKSCIVLGFVLLGLQVLSELIKKLALLRTTPQNIPPQ